MVTLVFAAGLGLTLLILLAMQLSAKLAARRDRAAAEAVTAQAAVDREAQAVADRERARRKRRADRIARFGIRSALHGELLQQPFASQRAALSAQEAEANRQRSVDEDRVQEAVEELRKAPIRNRVVATVGTAIWLVCVAILYILDRDLLLSIGFGDLLATVLALTVAAVLEAIGLLFFGVIGVHEVSFLESAGKQVKAAVACGTLTLLAAVIAGGLIPLSSARADEAVGDKLRSAESVLVALEADPGVDPATLTAQQLTVEKLRQERDQGMNFGSLVTPLTGVVTFGFSWIPTAAVAHLGAARAKRRLAQSDRRLAAVRNEQRAFDAEFLSWAAAVLDEAGFNPADAAVLLEELPDDVSPGTPSSAPVLPPPATTRADPAEWAPPSAPDVFPPAPGAPPAPSTPPIVGGSQNPPDSGQQTLPPPDPFNLFPRSEP